MKKALAEGIGTFALVFFGTGAIIVNDEFDGIITHGGIAIAFGAVVAIMIYTFGTLSGAHINPAVTLAFSLTDRFDSKSTLSYLLAQFGGAILASLTLYLLFPLHDTLGATQPKMAIGQVFLLEAILTFFLMLVIVFVSQNKSVSAFTGLAVGLTVMLEAWIAGPLTGASMNPARSLGPALIAGEWNALWLYLLAPILGAVLAVYVWKFLREK